MQMKDIEVGQRYAAFRYVHGHQARKLIDLKDHEFDNLAANAVIAEVIEKNVQVGHYKALGVLVRWYSPQDGSEIGRNSWSNETLERMAPQPVRCMSLFMPWEKFEDEVAERTERELRAAIELREQRDREAKERQERAAKEWMERAFERARAELERCADIFEDHRPGLDPLHVDDADVRKLVELKYPAGNPYLNGTETATW